MQNLSNHIYRLRNKIHNSSGCSYLYSKFDELIKILQENSENLTKEDIIALNSLIKDFAEDTKYNYGSANWVRYSARCFYCADTLTVFLPQEEKNDVENMLSIYFYNLIQSGVSSIIEQTVFDKYFYRNIKNHNSGNSYDVMITNTISASHKGRTWSGNEMSLAYLHTKAAFKLIKEYLEKYNDYSYLDKWIPLLNTKRLAEIWYNHDVWDDYSEDCILRSSHLRNKILVDEILDKMLDLHLELLDIWFWHNPEEMINIFSLETLIEILEVYDDDEFKKTLEHMVTFPKNEKVKGILQHFIEDEEEWIVQLSNRLLDNYKKNQFYHEMDRNVR